MFDLLQFKDNTAVIAQNGKQLTYGQLAEVVEKLYQAIPEKSLLFCLCENLLGSFVGYVACMNRHIPQVLLDGSKDLGLVQRLIAIYQPEFLWMPTARINEIGGKTIYQYHEYSLQQMEYAEPLANKEINPDLLLCLTTSGSTGSPKLVRLSEKNLKSNAESIAEYLRIDENERAITTLPSYYSYSVSVINSHLIRGATLLLTDGTVAQREFWNFMKENKATSMSGVPYTYEMLKRLRFFRMDIPSLKVMTQAGGKLNKNLAKEYIDFAAEKGKKFYIMYGQTEATARMSYLPFESASEKYSSIGIAIPGGTFRLMDDNGAEITESEKDGELIYLGKNVSLGYAECFEDLQKGDENKGILFTGDIARRDSEGYYYITGRKKRFIKIWGNRVNLDEAEQLIKEITPSCACVGVDDKMLIYLTDETKSKQCRHLLALKTGLNSSAFEIRVIDEIPINSSGKVLYSDLKNE